MQLKFHGLYFRLNVCLTCSTIAPRSWWSTLMHDTSLAEWVMKRCSSWCESFLGRNFYRWLALARTCVSTSHSGPRDDQPLCNKKKGITIKCVTYPLVQYSPSTLHKITNDTGHGGQCCKLPSHTETTTVSDSHLFIIYITQIRTVSTNGTHLVHDVYSTGNHMLHVLYIHDSFITQWKPSLINAL